MATVTGNTITTGFRGMIADTLVFRNVNGKTIVSARPSKPSRESEGQKKTRSKFKEATHFAHAMMLSVENKAYYTRKAKENGLPNAYTAAITEFMRKPDEKVADMKEEAALKAINLKAHSKINDGTCLLMPAYEKGLTKKDIVKTSLSEAPCCDVKIGLPGIRQYDLTSKAPARHQQPTVSKSIVYCNFVMGCFVAVMQFVT